MVATIKLSKAAYEKLLQSERNFHDLLQEFDKFEACGVDCALMRDGVAQQLQQISNIKQHFSPMIAG